MRLAEHHTCTRMGHGDGPAEKRARHQPDTTPVARSADGATILPCGIFLVVSSFLAPPPGIHDMVQYSRCGTTVSQYVLEYWTNTPKWSNTYCDTVAPQLQLHYETCCPNLET